MTITPLNHHYASILTPEQAPLEERDWQELLAASVVSAEQLTTHLPIDPENVDRVAGAYPMRINPYFRAGLPPRCPAAAPGRALHR